MASELGDRCPICLDSWEEASYVLPCLHWFCYPCIQRWAESKPQCPLCRRSITSIVHSVRADDDFEERVLTPPAADDDLEERVRTPRAAPPVISRQAGAPAAQSPAEAQPQPAGTVPGPPLRGLPPSTWASLFWDHPALLQPILTWIRQELGRLFEGQSPRAALVENLVLALLVLHGLDEHLLVQLLGVTLSNHSAAFVRGLIEVAEERCGGEAHRLLGLEDDHAARRQQSSPVAVPGPAASRGRSPTPGPAPSSSPQGSSGEDLPSSSAAALRGGPSRPPSTPVPTRGEREEPQEEPEVAAALPSTSSQGTESTPGVSRRPPKRRAGRSEGSSPAKKRPPHQC